MNYDNLRAAVTYFITNAVPNANEEAAFSWDLFKHIFIVAARNALLNNPGRFVEYRRVPVPAAPAPVAAVAAAPAAANTYTLTADYTNGCCHERASRTE